MSDRAQCGLVRPSTEMRRVVILLASHRHATAGFPDVAHSHLGEATLQLRWLNHWKMVIVLEVGLESCRQKNLIVEAVWQGQKYDTSVGNCSINSRTIFPSYPRRRAGRQCS